MKAGTRYHPVNLSKFLKIGGHLNNQAVVIAAKTVLAADMPEQG
jgi:hypothetical protein